MKVTFSGAIWWPNLELMQMAFYLAGEITQVKRVNTLGPLCPYLIFVASISSGARVKKKLLRGIFSTINAKRTPESVTLYTVCNFTHCV